VTHTCFTSTALLLYVSSHVDQFTRLSFKEQDRNDLEESFSINLQQSQKDVFGGYKQDNIMDVSPPLALLNYTIRELLASEE
jgi:hypothetical protein